MSKFNDPELPDSFTTEQLFKFLLSEDNDSLSVQDYLPGSIARDFKRAVALLQLKSQALDEWLDKTAWVQTTTQPGELGMHRADALKARLEAAELKNRELEFAITAMAAGPCPNCGELGPCGCGGNPLGSEVFRERSNHDVHRGADSTPCHCWADVDHSIGKEVRRHAPPAPITAPVDEFSVQTVARALAASGWATGGDESEFLEDVRGALSLLATHPQPAVAKDGDA